MNIKSPFTAKLERGMYSAVVYERDSLFVVEDEEGTVVIEDTDAATAIQKAIDDYAVNGLVLVKPDVTLTSTLKILESWSNIEFMGNILSPGVNAIELGDASNYLEFSTLKVAQIHGGDKTAHGIVFKNAGGNKIFYRQIRDCDIGLYFDAASGKVAAENIIEGTHITDCGTAAIRFSSNAGAMEGNHFLTTIFNSPIGFETQSGGDSIFQTYIGVIDCIGVENSEDIKDATGQHIFICDFVRRDTCTIYKDTIVMNALGNAHDSPTFENRSGSADLLNIGFTPLLMWDFNRDSTGEWGKNNCTMGTPSKSVTRITATAPNPNIYRAISVDGGQASVVIVRYKYVSGDKGSANIFYTTGSHGYSGSYYKGVFYLTTDGEWHMLVLDMSDLDAGDADWINNTITGFRFDPTTGTAVYDIDYIAIGTRGYASIYNMDDAMETPASASAVGNKGDIRWDASCIYICTAKDTWKRALIATW